MKFINKIQRFMIGRYGPDDLYSFLFKIYFILLIANLFLRSSAINIIEYTLVFIILYRFLSKNIYKRRKENNKFLDLKYKFLKPFKDFKKNLSGDYLYKRCSKCDTVLKLPLPYSRGIKHSKCPKCGKRLTIFVFRKQKVEIILNKS